MTPLLLALALVTQSTDIEREAAAGILRQIDSLEARLKPTENAQRLASRNDPARDRVLARVATAWNSELQGVSDVRLSHSTRGGDQSSGGGSTSSAGPTSSGDCGATHGQPNYSFQLNVTFDQQAAGSGQSAAVPASLGGGQ